MEAHMKADISAGRPCMLVARFFYRYAHSTKLHSTHKAPAFVLPFRHFTSHCHTARLCLSSSFQEDVLQNKAGARMIKVKFVLRKRCEFGQQFYVIGDNQQLGGWAPEAALPMQWSEGHVWTVELDLLSGTCSEFKVLLKADQDVLEWQQGPNRKLEVSDRVTPLVVFIPWSHEEENLENDSPGFMEMNDPQRTQDTVEITSSARSLSDVIDNVGSVDSATDASVSPDVIDELKTGERSDNNETIKLRAKDLVHEEQSGTKELFIGDRGLSAEGACPNSDRSPEEFFSLYPIPDSWYGEASRHAVGSRDFADPSAGLLEVNAPVRNLTSATEFYVNKEEEAGDKPLRSKIMNEIISEAMNSEAGIEHISKEEYGEQGMRDNGQADTFKGTMLSNAEPEAIRKVNAHSKGETGKQRTCEDKPDDAIAPKSVQTMVSNAEPELNFQSGNAHPKEENGKQLTGEDVPAETIVWSDQGTVLANDDPENIPEVSVQVLVSQPGLTQEAAEPKGDLIVEPAVLCNEKPTADELTTLAENEESETPRMQSDPVQTLKTNPAKEKKEGHKGWSKLWNAFVRGRIE